MAAGQTKGNSSPEAVGVDAGRQNEQVGRWWTQLVQNQRICEPGVWACVTAPSQTWGPRESTCRPPKSPVCPGDGGRALGWSPLTKGAVPPHPALLGLQPPEPRGLAAFQACLAGVTSGTCPCSPAENSTSPVLHLVSVSSCLFPSCGRGPSHGFWRERVHGRETPQVHTRPSLLILSWSLEIVDLGINSTLEITFHCFF